MKKKPEPITADRAAITLGEIADKFPPLDLSKIMRDHARKMACDARYIAGHKRQGKLDKADTERLHYAFIAMGVKDLQRLSRYYDAQADAIELSIDALASLKF